jgi:hypothetical protein
MLPRLASALAAATTLVLLAASPAAADSVAFIDGSNLWLSSPDGAQKFQVTTGGTEDRSWNFPAQGPDGKTVVSHRDQFDDGSSRPVLYLYGPDGKFVTANVMPVYSGATIPVYPIGLDIDFNSNAVAYGYSYCGFACQSTYKGFWLTFSDNQGLYPSDPQGQSDAYNPSFFGTRVVFRDSGGSIFIQPDVPEAPFTSSYQGWLSVPDLFLSRTEVAKTGRGVGIEWSQYDSQSNLIGEGIFLGQHQGTVPSDVTEICNLPVAAGSSDITFSPDGQWIAWHDAEGVKVAGVPNFAAGTDACTLSSPARVISASGHSPSFGGANVAAINAGGGGGGGGGGGASKLRIQLKGKATRNAFAHGLVFRVYAQGAGKIAGSASIKRSVAHNLDIAAAKARGVLALLSDARGFAAAKAVVVARGKVKAKKAGWVKLKLKPTKKAKRKAKKMRGVKLTIKISQGASSGKKTIKLR